MTGVRPGWDEALEAAARCRYEGSVAMSGLASPAWVDLRPSWRVQWIEDARVHLEAAYPVIRYAVLRDAAQQIDTEADQHARGLLHFWENVSAGLRLASRIVRREP